MKDFRKAQMKLALLLEIEAEPKKNSEVIKGAEERLILDDAYNRLMQNGKQTIGSKEMQFLLYYIKRDDIADLPSRGMYRENENTVSEREQLISDILEVLNTDENGENALILKEETLAFIKGYNPEKKKNKGKDKKKKSESKQDEKTPKTEMEFVSLDGTDGNTTVAVDTEENALSADENDKNDIFPKP